MAMIGTGELIKVHGTVNTMLMPILHFTVRNDHPKYVPGNLLLINGFRYWIRARQPDEPRRDAEVQLVLYRDYTTRKQRLMQRSAVRAALEQRSRDSYSRAVQHQLKLGYSIPTFDSPTAQPIVGDAAHVL